MSPIATYGDTTSTTSSAGTSGTFPGAGSGSLDSQLNAVAAQLKGMSPTEFFADYDITSTQQPSYLSGASLNWNAVYLAYYLSQGQSGRQSIQNQMADAGLISPNDADGLNNSTSLTALKSLIGTTSAQGSNVYTYLSQNSSGTNVIQNQISANLTKAQENATQPIIADVENPSTLSADITSAFETALGYSPDQAQISSFISQVQGQDTAYAEAPRAEAQAQVNLAHSEDSALNKLGPDGIDQVISAYQAAVTGTKMIGAGTTQGTPIDTSQAQAPVYSVPGATGPPVTTHGWEPQPSGGISSVLNNIGNAMNPVNVVKGILNPQPAKLEQNLVPTSTTKRTKISPQQLAPTHFAPPTVTTYGGIYALNAADWQQAQKLLPAAKKYNSAGQAPQSIQLAAFSSLLSNAYDNNGGSWSKAISEIASGTPFGQNEGSHLSAFGDSVASEVNDQINALQTQVNDDTVTTKVSQPDANAEADLAAKQSDPTGYYAAQSASWGEVLNKMLSGTPDMYDQSSSDTFTGPVASEASTPALASAGAV